MMYGIPSESVPDVRDRALPLVERGLKATGADVYWPAEWVLDECEARNKQLWVGGDFEWLAITQISVYPTGLKELDVFVVAGDGIEEWYPVMVETLKEFGKAVGCRLIAGNGRKGWLKWHKTHFPGEGILTYRMAQEI